MRRFFFSIDEAVDLVKFALENSHNFSGKIISTEMKSSLIIDVLKVWIKKYGGKYYIVKSRKGDREDEFLFGFNEIDYVQKVQTMFYFFFNIFTTSNVKQIAKPFLEEFTHI